VELKVIQRFALKEELGFAAGLGVLERSTLGYLQPGERVYFSARWGLEEPLERGSILSIKGVIAPTKLGGEGFDEYLERSHISWRLERAKVLHVAKPAPFDMRIIEALRRGTIATLERNFGEEKSNGLLSAMVIGARAEISKAQKEAFLRSGTMHLLAISGLNVMVVAGLIVWVGRLLGLRGVALAFAVAEGTYLYAQIAGGAPSVMRAWGMVFFGAVGYALRRQVKVWPVLILTAIASLMVEPLSLWHAGWRLSFGVVAGMVLGMGALERLLPTQRLPFWLHGVWQSVAVSIIAGISVFPMTAVYFGLWQPWGWALNAVVVLLAGWITILGFCSMLLFFLPIVPEALNTVSGWLLSAMEWLIDSYLKLPGAVAEVKLPDYVEWVGSLALLGAFYILARLAKKKEF